MLTATELITPCPTCRQYPSVADVRRGHHVCPPFFLCQFDWQREDGDEPKHIYADDADGAAERFVEQSDEDNVTLTENSTVIVLDPVKRKAYKIIVDGEIVRIYRTFNDAEEIPYAEEEIFCAEEE